MKDSRKKIIRTLIALGLMVCLVPVSLQINQSIEESQYLTEDEWNESFELAYGSTLPDFYELGGEGFQARWLTDAEDSKVKCVFQDHCVYIKLATIAECEKGVIVEFAVLTEDEKVITQEKTPVFPMKAGEYVAIELGSRKLTEKGLIEPIDAYCSDVLPSV